MSENWRSEAIVALVTLVALVSCIGEITCQYLSHEPYPHSYNPYNYGYDIEDNYGNKQWRSEKSHSPHEVHGSYGFRDNNGIYREVVYVADKDGFRANVKSNEPGLAGSKDPAGVKIESYYPASSNAYAKHIPAAPVYYSHQQCELIG